MSADEEGEELPPAEPTISFSLGDVSFTVVVDLAQAVDPAAWRHIVDLPLPIVSVCLSAGIISWPLVRGRDNQLASSQHR